MLTTKSRKSLPNSYSRRTCNHIGIMALVLGVAVSLSVPGVSHAQEPVFNYRPNPIMTTSYGPAKADIVTNKSNFVPCFGGPIALCYYSGPEGDDPDLSCEVTSNREFSNCRCVEIPQGPYAVDINAILDQDVYHDTVKKCGKTGIDCQGEPNKAPVCQAIQEKQLLPDAVPAPDTISTFSLALATDPNFGLGQTNCPEDKNSIAPYAGCMTAPCARTDEEVEYCKMVDNVEVCNVVPVDICTCPNFTGRYQIGQAKDQGQCIIGEGEPGDNIWSAAYNPTVDKVSQVTCAPDLQGNNGCPLLAPIKDSYPLEPDLPPRPKDISCGKVCAEYRNVQNGVEVGFTCDATLCTVPFADLGPDVKACDGLNDGKKGISEILKLELEAGCSCCASQICGCKPSDATNDEIRRLNDLQRAEDIQPQCDYNGTLCGE